MNERSAPPPPDSSRSVAEAIARWARALSDVGGPNTLLWAPDRSGGYLDLTTAHPGGVSMLLAGRVTYLSDLVREPQALGEALTVVRDIHVRTRRLEQERGLVSGFAAVGMATWDPPRPGATVAAPVLLRACRLRPVSPAEDDFQVDLARSVEVNPVLVNYLRSVAGIAVDPVGLAALTRVASSFDPYPVYSAIKRACTDIPGFEIAPKLVIGAYPYAKLPMVADLTENTEWLAQVDLVAALAGDRAAKRRLSTALPEVEPDPDPARELLVLDADATQASVVDAVRSGTPLVLLAPHGTGATQAVANAVAALAHDGKRTLLVTPSRASIRDLVDRLGEVGLGDLVLDLTAAATDRHTVAGELGQALARVQGLNDKQLGKAAEPSGGAARERAIAQVRRILVDHVQSVHQPREPWSVSVHEIQSAMAALASHKPAPASRIRLRGAEIRNLSRSRVDELARDLRGAAEAGAWSDDPAGDPWYGARIRTEDDVRQAREVVTRLAQGGLATPADTLDGILAESAVPPATCADDWDTALRTMRGVRDTLEIFRPEVFDVPLDEHVYATGSASFRESQEVKLGRLARSRVRRHARRMLRPGRPPADLHAELQSAQEQRRAWHRLVGAGGRPEISPRLDEAQQVYDVLGADLSWLGERLAGTEDGGDLARMPLPRLKARISRLAARLERLDVLPTVSPALDELREAGVGAVLDDFARRSVAVEHIGPELEHIWWASVALDVNETDPRRRDHNGPAVHQAADRYRVLDREQRDETAAIVRARVDQRARWRLGTHPQQVELLRAQAAGERWLLPFHDVFREAEDVLTALHPCLAMSPYAVAQLLPPGTSFDLVVVQDAFSVATAEVVSALSRGRQALVVGDPHGVTPSSFIVGPRRDPSAPSEQAAATSVLDEASALLPTRALDWHHGGVDTRLLSWSRAGSGLLGAPRPSLVAPIQVDHVDGSAPLAAGDDSAIEWTQAEVERIVQIALDHARHTPALSLGVVTLTAPLAVEVTVTLRHQLHLLASQDAADPAVAFFDENRPEPFVVTPLHSAAATRDVVVIGVGYGRTLHGRVLHRFPSLAAPGAEHRLARAAGLARHSLVLVSSLTAADLDPERLKSPGAAALRELLAWAENPAAAAGPARDGLNPLLGDLAARLKQEGLTVAPRVGPERSPVELAVGHPAASERFLVAVETDGPEYAGLVGVRERERLRREQLERLGWRAVRVWSTDLYRDPAREVARVVATVREARREPGREAEGAPDLESNGQERTPAATESEPGPQQSPVVVASGEPAPGDMATGDSASSQTQGGDAGGMESDLEREAVLEPAATGGGNRGRRRRFRRAPDQTADDTDVSWGELLDEAAHENWLREQRPPHWH